MASLVQVRLVASLVQVRFSLVMKVWGMKLLHTVFAVSTIIALA